MLAVEHFFVSNFLAGVGGHAAQAGREAGLDAARDFIVGLVVADGVHQVVPFIGVWVPLIGRDFRGPNQVGRLGILAFEGAGRQSDVSLGSDNGHAFAALGVAGIYLGA